MNMKKLKKDQRGLTLVELLIVIAITGIITGGITMSIFQVFNINTRTANRMAAVSQVENAGSWVSPDIQMAREIDTESEFLKLTWIEIEGAANYTHEVIYTLEDSELWRSHSVNDGEPTLTRVAEYIDPVQTSCIWAGGVLTFEVTATVGEQSETREYKVKPRPGSS